LKQWYGTDTHRTGDVAVSAISTWVTIQVTQGPVCAPLTFLTFTSVQQERLLACTEMIKQDMSTKAERMSNKAPVLISRGWTLLMNGGLYVGCPGGITTFATKRQRMDKISVPILIN
jgi:hypothetical protein